MSRKPTLSEEEMRLFKLKYEVIKKKLPRFIRQESWRYVRIKESWRRPRGKDSKMRLHKKGRPPLVKVGYRTPKLVRHFHPSGFQEVLVYNVKDVEMKVKDPGRQAIRIAGSVGRRKRMEIIEYADKHGIKVLNRRL
jgi:large subunit ribosomal protein L32e